MSQRVINVALAYTAYQCFLNAPISCYSMDVRWLKDGIRRLDKAHSKGQYASDIYFHGRDVSLEEARLLLAEKERRLATLRKFSPVDWVFGSFE